MTQSSLEPLPDLRELRTTFLGKQLAYALSYEYTLQHVRRGPPADGSVQLRLHADPPDRSSGDVVNRERDTVFHVLGGDRVPGLDNLGRDVPKSFKIRSANESVTFYAPADQNRLVDVSSGAIKGRMILEAPRPTDVEPLSICMAYDGTLQLLEAVNLDKTEGGVPRETVRASAFIVPFFETLHPKYHWLTENACIAFGTWELDGGVVAASFDVYCAS